MVQNAKRTKCHDAVVRSRNEQSRYEGAITVGIDRPKHVFQVHGVGAQGVVVKHLSITEDAARHLRRNQQSYIGRA